MHESSHCIMMAHFMHILCKHRQNNIQHLPPLYPLTFTRAAGPACEREKNEYSISCRLIGSVDHSMPTYCAQRTLCVCVCLSLTEDRVVGFKTKPKPNQTVPYCTGKRILINIRIGRCSETMTQLFSIPLYRTAHDLRFLFFPWPVSLFY